MTSSSIPISRVELPPETEQLVLDVLRSGHLAQGPMVQRLEAAFCEIVGVDSAVAVSNGTIALVAALQAIEVVPGSEVVTSPFTFVATANAALAVGARIRFADIVDDDFTIDPKAAEAAMTPQCAALLPVHLYGQPADCDALVELADRHGVALVEDAAQAHGATFDGRHVGSFGIGCFSLYATKNVTTGEGGIVTTNDAAIADRLRLLRNQGMRERYQYEIVGHNYRMTDLQAAVGLPQLANLETATAARERNAAQLSEGLAGIDGVVTPVVRDGRRHVFHQYTIRVTDDARLDRDALARELGARGIGTGIYYPRVATDYECFRDHPLLVQSDVPNARRAAREVLSLPVHPHVTETDCALIVDTIRTLMA